MVLASSGGREGLRQPAVSARGLETALRPEGGRRSRSLWLDAPGARLHAWLISPTTPPPWPLVVMAHGWAAVKEMNLDYFAAAMGDAGLAALVFDHRGLGASSGPRGDIDPEQQIADYRFALTLGERLDGVDRDRMSVWGTSYSGGHVLCVAERDRRVRAAVAQVPTISGSESARRRGGGDWASLRDDNVSTGKQGTTPVPPHELPPAPRTAYGDDERDRFYAELPEARRRTWCNRVTRASVQRYAAYEPGLSMPRIDVPLLVIAADADTITPTDLIRGAVARSGPNVRSLDIGGGHYGVYTERREQVAGAASEFLRRHLQ